MLIQAQTKLTKFRPIHDNPNPKRLDWPSHTSCIGS